MTFINEQTEPILHALLFFAVRGCAFLLDKIDITCNNITHFVKKVNIMSYQDKLI